MKFFNNLNIRAKMFTSFGLIVLMVVALTLFAIYNTQSVDDTYDNAINHPISGKMSLMETRSHLLNLRRIVTSMIMNAPSGDALKIDAYYKEGTDAYSAALVSMDDYVEIVKTNENYSVSDVNTRIEAITEIRRLFDRYKNEILDPVAAAARVGDYDTALAISNEAVGIANELNDNVTDLNNKANQASDQAIADAASTAASAIVIFLVIAAIVVLFSVVLSVAVSSLVSKPIKQLVEVAESVAKGHLNVNINTESKDEIGMLGRAFADMTGIINNLTSDIKDFHRIFYDEGDIDAKMDSSKFDGAYKDVAENINELMGGAISDTLLELRLMDEYANGDFSLQVPQMPGKKIVINKTVDKFKVLIKSLNSEITNLARDVVEGKLSNRADANAFNGEWANLMRGLNGLMDAVSTPVAEVSAVMRNVSAGDFDVKMNMNYKGDFHELSKSVNATVTNIASYIEEISHVLHSLSMHDLNQGIKREYIGSFTRIKDALNSIINTLNSVVGDISSASDQVTTGAKSISESSMTMAQGATEQAAAVQELNATVLTINESTTRNAENARTAESLSSNSKSNASVGDRDMKDMLTSMDGIKESSNKISKIIKVIEDIAFQTNLLALNAAVEAARAGEHGKGFAVVAEEVRTLASRSQTAARETAALIEESIERVEGGTHIADKTADALRKIVDDIDKIADIIADISESSIEQSEAVKQVVQGLNMITEVVQNNSATSEESASASQQLYSQAELMRNHVSVFKLRKP